MMCASYVYKRRKLRNSVALLPKENAVDGSTAHDGCNSGFSSGNVHHLLTMKKDDSEKIERTLNTSFDELDYRKNPSNNRNSPVPLSPDPHNPTTLLDSQLDGIVVLALASVPEGVASFPVPKRRVYKRRNHVNKPRRLTPDRNSIANESCSSSKSNLEQFPALTKTGEEDACECSSSGVKGVTQQADCHPSKEFCINVLKRSELIGGSWPINGDVSLEILGGNGAGSFRQCNVCGLMGIPRKMLICDLCEEAFHLPCCQVKESPRDDWYCQPCLSTKPKPLLDIAAGKLFPTIGEEYKRRILQQELGPIHFMLIDTQPYTSGVRIGKDFQVEVPECSGPIPNDSDHFDELSELNPLECGNMKDWNSTKSLKASSIGNWLQCREVVYNGQDDNDNGVVCGKWRRAPLFATQTDDWDCSCSVVWDPFHADCAVPQELETDEVLKHLKYVELLRTRLSKKKKSG